MDEDRLDPIGVTKDIEVVVPEVDQHLQQLSPTVDRAEKRRVDGLAQRQVAPFVATIFRWVDDVV